MNTLEAIATRRSTRAYQPRQIPEEVLDTILKAAAAAPIAMAKYDRLHITVIQNGEMIAQINELSADFFFKRTGMRKNMDFGAKTMIFVSTDPTAFSPEMAYSNVGIVVENMVLAATDLGISSVVLGGAPSIVAQDAELVRALGIPEGFKPVLGAAFGYAVDDEIAMAAKDHTITVNRV